MVSTVPNFAGHDRQGDRNAAAGIGLGLELSNKHRRAGQAGDGQTYTGFHGVAFPRAVSFYGRFPACTRTSTPENTKTRYVKTRRSQLVFLHKLFADKYI
jgi:hypothetical protein